MSASTTEAPASAKALAVASPMPELAPVIRATWLLKSYVGFMVSLLRSSEKGRIVDHEAVADVASVQREPKSGAVRHPASARRHYTHTVAHSHLTALVRRPVIAL